MSVAFLIGIGLLLGLIASLVITFLALIEVGTREPSENQRVGWIVLITLLNILGVILYWTIRRPQRIEETGR